MHNTEVEKLKVFDLTELAEYLSDSTLVRTLVRKNTGTISMNTLDSGQSVQERVSRFDTFIYVIDGTADVTIDTKLSKLAAGQCMIIPAHSRFAIGAAVRFKMMSIVIKSGYEEL